MFKTATGVTPRAYAAALRAERVRRRLEGDGNITDAIYGAGYNSAARFYAESTARLGMTPSEYRAAGAALPIRFAVGRGVAKPFLAARPRETWWLPPTRRSCGAAAGARPC